MTNELNGSTFLTDSILFIRDTLISGLTDPISGSRPSNSKFIMTSYPQRTATYPLITVKDDGIGDAVRLGMQSEKIWLTMPIEVRVWARNVKERDDLSQKAFTALKDNQFSAVGITTTASTTQGLHAFTLLSALNIDDIDENNKETGIRTKQLRFQYKAIIN